MHFAIASVLLMQFVFSETLNIRIHAAGTHEPVATARVRIEKLGFTVYDVPARDGRVAVANLVPGRYTIVVDADGYETSYSEVTLPGDSFSWIDLHPSVPKPLRPQSSASGPS